MLGKAHEGQTYTNRSTVRPYFYHLTKTARIAEELDFDDIIVAACFLHDSLEDTALSKERIAEATSSLVADIVWGVTDEEGKNRRERKQKTYLKIKEDWKAIAVKLCDRIANVEASIKYDVNKLIMYQKEQRSFEEALRTDDERLQEAWERLDNLFKSVN